MGIIENGIVVNVDNTISFGNHIAKEKVKVDDFKIGDDIYKLRTYNEVTRLTKNHILVFESTPGVTVHNFKYTENKVEFSAEGATSAQLTVELTPDTEFKILCNGHLVDETKSNSITGKLSFSTEFVKGKASVVIEKI